MLFVLGLDNCLRLLNSQPNEQMVLAYADDLIILTNDIGKSVSVCKMLLNTINLTINETKTKRLVLGKKQDDNRL